MDGYAGAWMRAWPPLTPQYPGEPGGDHPYRDSVNLFEQDKSARECEEAFVEFEKYGLLDAPGA